MFLSSHLLAEVAHSADDAIIINHGRLVERRPGRRPWSAEPRPCRRHPRRRPAGGRPAHRGATITRQGHGEITVAEVNREVIGRAALDVGAVILDMRAQGDDLETVFQALIHPQAATS